MLIYLPRAGCGKCMLIRQVSLNKNELSFRSSRILLEEEIRELTTQYVI